MPNSTEMIITFGIDADGNEKENKYVATWHGDEYRVADPVAFKTHGRYRSFLVGVVLNIDAKRFEVDIFNFANNKIYSLTHLHQPAVLRSKRQTRKELGHAIKRRTKKIPELLSPLVRTLDQMDNLSAAMLAPNLLKLAQEKIKESSAAK